MSDTVGLGVSLVSLFFLTEDLWESLEKASGKPIAAVMNTWTKQMGFPLIYVEAEQVSGAVIPLTAAGLISEQMFCLSLRLRSNLVLSSILKTCSELLCVVAGLFLQGGEEEEPGGKRNRVYPEALQALCLGFADVARLLFVFEKLQGQCNICCGSPQCTLCFQLHSDCAYAAASQAELGSVTGK